MTLWEQRKPLDELTNLLAAKACVEIGWAAYGHGLSKQVDTDIMDLLNTKPATKSSITFGRIFWEQGLYYQAVKEFERTGNVKQLWQMGVEQLKRGLMEKACEAFRAAARVILARDK